VGLFLTRGVFFSLSFHRQNKTKTKQKQVPSWLIKMVAKSQPLNIVRLGRVVEEDVRTGRVQSAPPQAPSTPAAAPSTAPAASQAVEREDSLGESPRRQAEMRKRADSAGATAARAREALRALDRLNHGDAVDGAGGAGEDGAVRNLLALLSLSLSALRFNVCHAPITKCTS
jgi:type IV secretory pathway VirB10-like protein